MLISAEAITRSFGPKEVITSAGMVIEPGDRIGLVGDNGSGKTTLIRILMGELKPDSGDLRIRTDRIGYLPQFPDFNMDAKVREVVGAPYGQIAKTARRLAELEEEMSSPDADWNSLGSEYSRLQEEYHQAGGHYFSTRSGNALEKVGLSAEILDKKISRLSGGERTKVMLARVVIQSSDVDMLFLDEPTSHLDVETMEWLEDYLMEFTGGVIMISHDRYFLDRIVTRIVELKDGTTRSFIGNYTDYSISADARKKIISREAEKNRIERERQERVIEEQKRRWKYKTTFKTRQKLLEKTEVIEGGEKEADINIKMDTGREGGKNIIMAKDLSIKRGEITVIREGEIDLEMGDKMGIFGPNGSGKTSILKAIMGEIPHSGDLWVAKRANQGYFAQGHDGLDPELTAEEQLLKAVGRDNKALARQVLARFLIKGKDAEREISSLSGGERARVALAHLIAQRRNLLILDEPTNYLDIRSKNAIEEALRSYKGTVLIVTHDRYLLDRLCNKIGFVHDGILRTYTGNYTQVKGQRDLAAMVEQAEAYRVVSKFTDWKTNTKYRAGDRIVIAFSEMDRFKQAMDMGYLKRIRGNEKKKVKRERH
ncbi:MAG: ABC-F family ATP-binding cassette domain-containing protein [Thermoplasmatota archaeon]